MTYVYSTYKTTIPINLTYYSNITSNYGGFVELTDHNSNTHNSNSGGGIPQWWYLTPGTYTWKLDVYDWDLQGQSTWRDSDEITFYVKHTIYVKNHFNAGTVKIDDASESSGSAVYKYVGNNLEIEAVDQTSSGIKYIWNTSGTNNSNWKRQELGSPTQTVISYARNYNHTVLNDDNGATIKATMNDKPATPQNLSVTESGSEHPSLSWTANTESDLDKYNIYRKGGYPFVDWTVIGTSTTNSYEDTDVTTTYSHGEDFYYKVSAVDDDNIESDHSSSVYIEARLEKGGLELLADDTPKEYSLNANYPNPFNPSTTISYQIPKKGFVTLEVYNSAGQSVEILVNKNQSAGRYNIEFNALTYPSGVYFYRIKSKYFNSTKKMILMK